MLRHIVRSKEPPILDALGNLGDFIGGIAVVFTLLYLALQVRHNTSALRTTSRQAIVEGMRAHMRMRLAPGRAQAFAEGLRSFPDIPEEDRSGFGILLGDLALFMQSAFALHEAGTLEEETYQAYLTFFVSHIATPGGRVWWENLGRPVFTPRMVRAMDARLAEGGTLDLIGLLGTFEPDSGSSADRRPA